MSPEDLDRLEAANAELAEAERAWDRLRSKTDLELDRATAIHQQRQLLVQARELLGQRVAPDQAAEALRAFRVPLTPPEVVAASLQTSLAEVGVAVENETLDHEDLIALAEACINEVDQAARRRREAEAELQRLVVEIEDLRIEVARIEAEAAERRAEGVIDPLEAARERADVARARVARDEEAAADMAALSGQLEQAVEAEEKAIAARDAADAALSVAVRAREEADAGLTVAEHELSEAVRLQNQAAAELRRLEEAGAEAELARLVATVAEREEQLERAQDELAQLRAATADVEAEYEALTAEHEQLLARLGDARDESLYTDPLLAPVDDDDPGTEDVEWFLLARLADQRGLSYAGSVPLLLDDALRDLHAIEVNRLLTRLEQMSDAVQVIVVTDAPAAADWAATTGPERAAVVGAVRLD
jgi:DNA repair exonuclease SbcCD ATPase subunit